MKTKEWQELTRLTQGEPLIVERVRLANSGIAIEGEFELPPLARLTSEEQVFVMVFLRCEGTIKEMEKAFGVSYPTIKARLSKIAAQMQLVEVVPDAANLQPAEKSTIEVTPKMNTRRQEILNALERGEITAQQAIERLSK